MVLVLMLGTLYSGVSTVEYKAYCAINFVIMIAFWDIS